MAEEDVNFQMTEKSEESDADNGDENGNEEMDAEPVENDSQAEKEGSSEQGGEDEPRQSKDERYSQLLSWHIKRRVANELYKLMEEGKISMADLDKKLVKKLCVLRVEDGVNIVKRFGLFNLDHVTNKSAFFLSQIVMFRQQQRRLGSAAAYETVSPGPDPEKLTELLQRTGYALNVTRGRRRYGGPPPDWEGDQPITNSNVYVTGIPKDMYEDTLVPLFERFGRIWQMCLMTDPFTNFICGFSYITYCKDEEAQRCVEEIHGYEIREGAVLKANIALPHVTLFMGSLPNNKTQEEVKEEFASKTEGLLEVELIPYEPSSEELKNIPMAGFLTYSSFKLSSEAKRSFKKGGAVAFDKKMHIARADARSKPEDGCLKKVTLIHLNHVPSSQTAETLRKQFQKFGEIELVEKSQDHGFVKFISHESAIKAMAEHNGVWRQACTLYTTGGESFIQASLEQEYGKIIIDISLGAKEDYKKKSKHNKGYMNNRSRGRGSFGRGQMQGRRGGSGLLPFPSPFRMHPPIYRGGLPMPPPPEDLWAYEEYMSRDGPPYRGRGFQPPLPYENERYGRAGCTFNEGPGPARGGYRSLLGAYGMGSRGNPWETWQGWDRPQPGNRGPSANKRKSGTVSINRGKKRIKSQSK